VVKEEEQGRAPAGDRLQLQRCECLMAATRASGMHTMPALSIGRKLLRQWQVFGNVHEERPSTKEKVAGD
jgi:hypothetical protein